MKALISIDYTVDFVADDGKLTAGAPAQAISETKEPMSFLPLMGMTLTIHSILKVSFSHLIISLGRVVVICTAL